MRRRTFIALIGGVLVWVATAEAQPARKVPRLGVLAWERCPTAESIFGRALRDLGYAWGQTIHVVCRSAEEDHARLPDAATTLAAQSVDVIMAFSHITAYAARRATQSTPIVMIASGDPVRSGLVASLARPGGNVTGLTYYGTELVEKRLQLLKEIAPHVTRVGVLGNSESDHVFGLYRQDAERAARALGLAVVTADVSQARDLGRGFEMFVQNGAQGLLVLTDPMLRAQAQSITDLAAKHRLPAIYWGPWFMDAGGLVAYSADYDYMVRRTAYYVDRIVKGARPADIPVEQPTRFELVINLRTAKALGLTIPSSVLARVDRTIE
jgi:putative ABC transport system substrate-binding protein